MKCKYQKCLNKAREYSPFCSIRCKGNFNVANRRRKLKTLAIEHKGGKCERCGYNRSVRALTFHHLDPAKKDFAIGVSGATRSWEKVKTEVDKCALLCANCHAEEHDRLEKEKLVKLADVYIIYAGSI